LLSTGSSAVDAESDIEYDDTFHLVDEFDKYRDQNLEKMRKEVEGSLADTAGMMSQALTRALMDGMDEDDEEMDEVQEHMDSMEVEATVLYEISDWLKKKEGATPEERRELMQDTLNEMVFKVRRGAISPEHASRTIHGCGAMLGLQLEENLPGTTLIVTGIRKKAKKEDVVEAFKEFGDIENAAMATNSRGFGVVRYRSPTSVQRAMDRYRMGEIVVQDVAANVRVLKEYPLGEVDMTRQYSSERRMR